MDDERLKNPPVGHSAVPDDSIGALAQAQISGETDMLAGSPNFGIFSENNVFSLPVETSRYVLFGLASRLDDLEPSTEGSLKVSTPAERPTEADEYMKRQIEVPISTASKGLFALLPQDIDAVLFSEELAQGSTYRADLDHLVLPISELVAHIHRALSEQSQIYPTVVACAEPDSTDDIASRRIQSASFFHPGS